MGIAGVLPEFELGRVPVRFGAVQLNCTPVSDREGSGN